jgi:hypothetical protein
LTDVLDITGTADVDKSAAESSFNEDIYFSAAVANETGNTASVNADNPDKASFTASTLKGAGDKATFTFSIVNVGDVDAKITPRIITNSSNLNIDGSEYFNVYSDWAGATQDLPAGTTDAAPLTYTVTVELIKTPTETLSGSFLIDLTATSVENATPAESETVNG